MATRSGANRKHVMPETSIEPDPPPTSPRTPESKSRALREFLRAGDARCPSCGYDVAGCEDGKCPECAWPMQLQLRPPTSLVPYWVFSLLINGWLFLWGTGGVVRTWLRVMEYHGMVSRRFSAGGSAAQPAGPGVGAPTSFGENFRMYFLSQSLLDQFTMSLFAVCCVVGFAGLLLSPGMGRSSPRRTAWVVSISIATFVATMANYFVTYIVYLMRAF